MLQILFTKIYFIWYWCGFNNSDANSVAKASGYSSEDADGSSEAENVGGATTLNASRDERDAGDRTSRGSAGQASSSPRTPSATTERKGLQKYVNVSGADVHALTSAQQAAAGTSSAGIAHLQGLQQAQQQQQPSHSGSSSEAAAATGPTRSAVATTSTGLAALARAGTLLNTNSIFDLEVISVNFLLLLMQRQV